MDAQGERTRSVKGGESRRGGNEGRKVSLKKRDRREGEEER